MITLNPEQREAVPFLRAELAKGGEMTFNAPTGAGKTIVLLEAIRDIPRVAYISRNPTMHRQTGELAKQMGVTNLTHVDPRTGMIGYFEVVIACESVRDVKINHHCVVRL